MRPSRLLLATDQLARCGATDLVLHLVEALDRRHFAPTVLALRGDDVPGPGLDAEEEGARRFRALEVPTRRLVIPATGGLPRRLRALTGLLRTAAFDVAHAHVRPADLWLTLAGVAAGTRVRLYSRQATYGEWPLALRARYAAAARLATRVIAVSDAVRIHLVEREGVPPRRIETIPDGIALEPLDRLPSPARTRAQLGLPADAPLVVTVAALTARKGHRFLVSAAERVLASHPETRFVFVGEGPERALLEAQLRATGRAGAFFLLGERADYAAWIAAADVFVLPSLWEGLNLSLLTACALGRPVVASNVGSNPEIVVDGETGLLPTPSSHGLAADTLDPRPLGDAIAALLADPIRAGALGARAKLRVRSRFSAVRMAERHAELYERLLHGQGLRRRSVAHRPAPPRPERWLAGP